MSRLRGGQPSLHFTRRQDVNVAAAGLFAENCYNRPQVHHLEELDGPTVSYFSKRMAPQTRCLLQTKRSVIAATELLERVYGLSKHILFFYFRITKHRLSTVIGSKSG